jgi:ABC-2 type transport system permease protein
MSHLATATATVGATGATGAAGLDYRGRLGLTLPRLVRSELIKLRSVKSTTWAIVVLWGCVAALAALVAATAHTDGNENAPNLAADMTLAAASLVLQPVAVIMGVLFATADYTSGAIRQTLAVAPNRWAVLTAKSLAAVAVLLVSATAAVGLGFAIEFGLMRARGFPVVVSAAAGRDLLGLALYGVVLGMVGFFAGFVTRSAVAGIGIGLGATLILPILVTLGDSVEAVRLVGGFLPEHLARQMWAAQDPDLGGFAGGLGLSLVWLAALFLATGVVFDQRDA